MRGRSKIEALTTEWYGFTIVSFLVQGVMALFGSGIFAVVTVPLVVGFAVLSLALTWGIGRLLVNKSQLVRVILLVLAPLAILGSGGAVWQMVQGSWSFGMVIDLLLVAGGLFMHVQTLRVLLDRDVRAYFR